MKWSTKMYSTMKKGSIKFWVVVVAALSLSYSTFILTKVSFASHRIKKKSNPFLCFSDVNGSTKDTSLANHQLPYGIQKSESAFATVLHILKGCDLPLEVKKNKCRKCVVVGNGGVLRNKMLGKRIDSFEVVIRINSGPVRGYESDVGKRTTFRLCYPESIFKDPRDADPDTTVVIIPFKPHDLRWVTDVLLHKPVILPTSGIIAITMALDVCEKVYIAGFKYDLSSDNYLHYYGNETMFEMTKNDIHDITAEQIFLHQLKYRQVITDLIEE
ncbi:type 2 lactosamine alpha-2,3-sialyltransferase-like isoform X6 [Acipenser ruthenus]|uniref:type 2 lactosamine alpha-2,3-sialyltransferase-like isoform X6 n=1 Tax=Acipenser ruthenus TaxID=7906 RepID=UPI00145B2976|nr:type 2 lactosamine alpha-2,3-sialyltransferase-like isoform X6 [Acipenser ruthenus]